jgi:hypothetical protein
MSKEEKDDLTSRDFFAGMALMGWLASFSEEAAHPADKGQADAVAVASYTVADAMMEARKQPRVSREEITNG